MEWTDAARAELDEACRRLHADLAARGDDSDLDPNDVVEDMRLHVHEELAASGVQNVTREDVRRVCARLDWGETEAAMAQEPPPPPPASDADAAPRTPWPREKPRPATSTGCLAWFIFFFGVLIPLGTLLVEIGTGASANAFVDPIPTIWHVALVLLVPVVIAAVEYLPSDVRRRYHKALAYGLGAAGCVALFYSIIYLPVMPFAAVLVIFLGLGLGPLSPAFSFVILCHLMRVFATDEGAPDRRAPLRFLGGAAVAVVALVGARGDLTVTNVGLRMAQSDSPETRERGYEWLREHGDEERLLRDCYASPSRRADELWNSWGTALLGGSPVAWVEKEEAREIYYRVTGRPFNAVARPERTGFGARYESDWEGWRDEGLASDQVAAKVKGVSLVDSLVDMKLEPAEAVGYCEWTMEFENSSIVQREARFHLGLPPGGVVSRVTLWIDGEEREAAFGSRQQTKAAYKSVVQRRRDPLLVTTSGVDRVLAQCFPIPPRGGRMKIRLGVTFPLSIVDADTVAVPHPVLEETNFVLAPEVEHSVWIESPFPLDTEVETLEEMTTSFDRYVVRGAVGDQRLADRTPLMIGFRPPEAVTAWASLSRTDESEVVIQTIEAETLEAPSRVVVVVDGSAPMAPHADTIATALMALPADIDLCLLIAGDEVVKEVASEAGRAELRLRAADAVRDFEYTGGRDGVPALRHALDLAIGRGPVVWLHGPQPVILAPLGPLDQALVRGRPRVPVYDVPVVTGTNVVAAVLHHRRVSEPLPRHGTLARDLEAWFTSLGGDTQRFRASRELHGLDAVDEELLDAAASRHLARLWVHDEIGRLLAFTSSAARDRALELSETHRLVTPVSGAVVLETAEQYEAAGLDPGDSAEVPAVPEPEMVILVSIVGLVLVFAMVQRRRGRAFAA